MIRNLVMILRHALAMPRISLEQQFSYLGADYAAGRRRAAPGAGAKRMVRARKARQRLAKASKLKSMRQADARLGKVCATGIKMGSQCGVEVTGVDDQEQVALRRQARAFLAPSTRGASLRAKLALHGGLMVRDAMAPALQWCKMIWQASTFPDDALISLAELGRLWERVISRGSVASSWARTRGPVARVLLCLARAGWVPEPVAAWRNRGWILIQPPQVSPAMLRSMLKIAFQAARETSLGGQLGFLKVRGRAWAQCERPCGRRNSPSISDALCAHARDASGLRPWRVTKGTARSARASVRVDEKTLCIAASTRARCQG